MSRPAPAHPAFPSINHQPVPESLILPRLPTTPAQLRDLITSSNTLQLVRDRLVPSLQLISEAKGPAATGTTPKEKLKRSEELLSLSDEDLYGLSHDRVVSMTAGLVYVM